MPLTKYRSKPAVPLAGKYRLIDIPLSNCLNSDINRIYVLTQFMSVSLHRHIRGTYRFDNFSGGFVEILAAQQTMSEGTDWYQGTADAVRKNLRYFTQPGIEYVVILSGDQLYRMDFAEMLKTHRESGPTSRSPPSRCTASEAAALGIMRVDDAGQVIRFVEKPKTEEEVAPVRTWTGVDRRPRRGEPRSRLPGQHGHLCIQQRCAGRMLLNTHCRDFGKEVFPSSIETHKVQLHLFDGYWEDIGTIRSFYEANLQLARPHAPYELTTATAPIYSRPRFLPPTRFDGATIESSLVADGCIIEPGTHIENSVIGLRCKIGRNVTIRDSIIMGADVYETAEDLARHSDLPPIGIGEGALVEKAIIDKNCRIGARAQVVNPGNQGDCEVNDFCSLRDGILVVEKDACLPAGWHVDCPSNS